MAQTIATIALIISIIVLQHLYNWAIRKLLDFYNEAAAGIIFATSAVMFVITYFLFSLLLEINK